MKHFAVLLFFALLLNGCGGKTPTEDLVDTANQTIDTMYNAIPVECRSETIKNLRDTSKEQVKLINDTCELQKTLLDAKITQRNIIILALFGIIVLYLGGKLASRFRL